MTAEVITMMAKMVGTCMVDYSVSTRQLTVLFLLAMPLNTANCARDPSRLWGESVTGPTAPPGIALAVLLRLAGSSPLHRHAVPAHSNLSNDRFQCHANLQSRIALLAIPSQMPCLGVQTNPKRSHSVLVLSAANAFCSVVAVRVLMLSTGPCAEMG